MLNTHSKEETQMHSDIIICSLQQGIEVQLIQALWLHMLSLARRRCPLQLVLSIRLMLADLPQHLCCLNISL